MLNEELDMNFSSAEMLSLAIILAAYFGLGLLVGWWMWA